MIETLDEVRGWRTAIKRGKLSAPVAAIEKAWGEDWWDPNTEESLSQYLRREGIRALDYGCGRGEDADILGIEKYDPYWHPEPPTGLYDLILCTYVLNVLDVEESKEVLSKLDSLVKVGGLILLTVRDDISEEGTETQRSVSFQELTSRKTVDYLYVRQVSLPGRFKTYVMFNY